jgi:hypothetical protein
MTKASVRIAVALRPTLRAAVSLCDTASMARPYFDRLMLCVTMVTANRKTASTP